MKVVSATFPHTLNTAVNYKDIVATVNKWMYLLSTVLVCLVWKLQ